MLNVCNNIHPENHHKSDLNVKSPCAVYKKYYIGLHW